MGALLGLGGGLVITGGGVLFDLLHHSRGFATAGFAVLGVGVLLGLPLLVGVPTPGRLAGLLLTGIFLLVMVPYGFRGAVLDWRGEQVRATVTEVRHQREPRTGGVTHTCRVLDRKGRSSWLPDSERCDAHTRPGDRYAIVRDPGDLVAASTSAPRIGFPVLVAYTVVGLALMAVIGAQTMGRSPGLRPG
ncbi:hypothetical protein [Streptomyces sp. NPDC005438]|uniref:hypothetical protein n=1 Tax=Streptomyces sp. NPDC005438 TaxID=3156880 RepID=UPI0033AEC7CF